MWLVRKKSAKYEFGVKIAEKFGLDGSDHTQFLFEQRTCMQNDHPTDF